MIQLLFLIQKYYQNESKFNGVYSRKNLSKIQDEAYLNEYESIGTKRIVFYVNTKNVTYFIFFVLVENIPKENIKFTEINITKNIYGIQTYVSEIIFFGFIDLMLEGQSLLNCTNFVSPNKFNLKIMRKRYQNIFSSF